MFISAVADVSDAQNCASHTSAPQLHDTFVVLFPSVLLFWIVVSLWHPCT